MADSTWIKDPDAVLDWHFDWTDWLSSGETITSSNFFVTSGLVVNSTSFTSSNTTIWLAGGSAGTPYTVTNRISTNQGRTDDRSVTVRVKDR